MGTVRERARTVDRRLLVAGLALMVIGGVCLAVSYLFADLFKSTPLGFGGLTAILAGGCGLVAACARQLNLDRLLLAGGLAAMVVAGFCVVAAHSWLGDLASGSVADGLIGAAITLAIIAVVALTTDALQAGWRAVRHQAGGATGVRLLLFTGLALIIDGGLSLAVAFASLNVGPGSGPDGGLGWVFLALFLAGAGVLVLGVDALLAGWRTVRHHGSHATRAGLT